MDDRLNRIVIDNFQSLKHAEIELGNLTILVGPGRSGKSAVIRALRCALLNSTGDDFIRTGAKQCSVVLEFSGMDVMWTKERGKSATYGIDGKMFFKTGHVVPEEIAERLRIAAFEVEQGFTVTPQLRDQFSPIFILAETGSRRARILGKVTRLDCIVTAQMECKTHGERHKRDAKSAGERLGMLQDSRAKLPDVTTIAAQAARIRDSLTVAHKSYDLVVRARHLLEKLTVAQTINAIDIVGLDEKLMEARDKLAKVEKAEALHRRLAASEDSHSEWIRSVETAQEHLAAAQAEYDAACKEAEVCTRCPFR